MKVGSLELDFLTNVAKLQMDMNAAKSSVERAMGDISGSISKVKGAMMGLLGGFTVGAFVGQLVQTQREFDILNSSLITVTGSSAAAKKEFAWIKQFAAETPFSLNEVTGAFIKMKALGLDASKEALSSYGNTASAMGKNINQMIEAVADAATGEFERLKEFGIKARKDGNDVALTFRGVTTNIKNNAVEIEDYLRRIGDVDFAGAMATRAATLDGAISNLGDTWSELFRTINDESAGSLIYDTVKLAIGAIEDIIVLIKAMSDETDSATQSSGAFKTIQEGLAIVFETVAVLGVNLKYVLVQIGNEIGGLAAQAIALMKLDLEAARAIGTMMKSDAEAARKQVDATTERILSARAKAAQAVQATAADIRRGEIESRNADGAREARRAAAAAASAKADADKKAKRGGGSKADPYGDFMLGIQDKIANYDAETNAQRKLTEAERAAIDIQKLVAKGKITQAQASSEQTKRLLEQLSVSEKANKEMEDTNRRMDENAQAMERVRDEAEKGRVAMKADLLAQQEANESIGKTSIELATLERAKMEDAAATIERRAELVRDLDPSGQWTESLKGQAAALRDLARAKQEGAIREFDERMFGQGRAERKGFQEQIDAFGRNANNPDISELDKNLERERMLRANGVDTNAMRVGLDNQMGMLNEYHANVRALQEQGVIDFQTAEQAKAQIQHQMKTLQLQGTMDMLGTLATLQNSSNKKLAAVGKAAAIAEATISGILAVQKALASGPPPWNYAMAAAVGVAAAANVAKIAGVKGFAAGGYTGDGSRRAIAGAVHGQEFVVNADATARNRPALEAMNSGQEVGGGGSPTIIFDIDNHIEVQSSGQSSDAQSLADAATTISKKTQADIMDSIRMGGDWAKIIKAK